MLDAPVSIRKRGRSTYQRNCIPFMVCMMRHDSPETAEKPACWFTSCLRDRLPALVRHLVMRSPPTRLNADWRVTLLDPLGCFAGRGYALLLRYAAGKRIKSVRGKPRLFWQGYDHVNHLPISPLNVIKIGSHTLPVPGAARNHHGDARIK